MVMFITVVSCTPRHESKSVSYDWISCLMLMGWAYSVPAKKELANWMLAFSEGW